MDDLKQFNPDLQFIIYQYAPLELHQEALKSEVFVKHLKSQNPRNFYPPLEDCMSCCGIQGYDTCYSSFLFHSLILSQSSMEEKIRSMTNDSFHGGWETGGHVPAPFDVEIFGQGEEATTIRVFEALESSGIVVVALMGFSWRTLSNDCRYEERTLKEIPLDPSSIWNFILLYEFLSDCYHEFSSFLLLQMEKKAEQDVLRLSEHNLYMLLLRCEDFGRPKFIREMGEALRDRCDKLGWK